ncbi:hypothetical protein ACJX0J_018034, partial [Zea mays]
LACVLHCTYACGQGFPIFDFVISTCTPFSVGLSHFETRGHEYIGHDKIRENIKIPTLIQHILTMNAIMLVESYIFSLYSLEKHLDINKISLLRDEGFLELI